jgi:hypothetical protein
MLIMHLMIGLTGQLKSIVEAGLKFFVMPMMQLSVMGMQKMLKKSGLLCQNGYQSSSLS